MSNADRVEAAGVPLRCHHCSGDQFREHGVTLDRTFFGGLMNLEGLLGRRAVVYTCVRCGFGHFFFPTPASPAEDEDGAEAQGVKEEAIRCLACSEEIPAGSAACPHCGWTWSHRT